MTSAVDSQDQIVDHVEAPSLQPDIAADGETEAAELYRAWQDGLCAGNLGRLVSLYAENAVIENSVVCGLVGSSTGEARGHAQIRDCLDVILRCGPHVAGEPKVQQWNGTTLFCVVERLSSHGSREIAEAMDIRDGKIHRHRIYWGWLGVRALLETKLRKLGFTTPFDGV